MRYRIALIVMRHWRDATPLFVRRITWLEVPESLQLPCMNSMRVPGRSSATWLRRLPARHPCVVLTFSPAKPLMMRA